MNYKEELERKAMANPFLVLENEIFQCLYNDIIYLRRAPGTVMNERQIAEEFGTSRTPVRKALAELESCGLLVRNKGRSIVIAHMSKEDGRSLYEARMAIEPQAVYLAAQRITPAELQHLKELNEKYRASIYTTNHNIIHSHALFDQDFHVTIVRAAKNKQITNMYRLIEKNLLHYRCCLLQEVPLEQLRPILELAVQHHETICHALELHFSSVAADKCRQDIDGMLNVFPVWSGEKE